MSKHPTQTPPGPSLVPLRGAGKGPRPVNLQAVRAYGDTLDDGQMMLSFALPVPFSEEAIRHLSYSPMAMDVYAWLGYL